MDPASDASGQNAAVGEHQQPPRPRDTSACAWACVYCNRALSAAPAAQMEADPGVDQA